MFIINFDDFFDGIVGTFFLGVGLVMFLVLALFTNYVSVGVGVGLTIGGIMSLLSIIVHLVGLYTSKEKNKIIEAGIITGIIIISMIISFIHPLYIQGLKIAFSKAASIFAEPLILYAIISLILWNQIIDEDFFSIITKLISIGAYICIGIVITGFAYFAGIDGMLTFLNDNFTYENRRFIDWRMRDYGSNDFQEVFPKIMQREKENSEKFGRTVEQREENFTRKNYNIDSGYIIDKADKEAGEHIYLLRIRDEAKYDENNQFKKYYVVVNLETCEVLEFRKNSVGIDDDEIAKRLERIETSKKIDEYNYMYYTMFKLKKLNAEITCENMNAQIDFIEAKSDVRCISIEPTEDGKLNATLSVDEGYRSGHKAKQVTINRDYTYEINIW